jgi:hypothetical protein
MQNQKVISFKISFQTYKRLRSKFSNFTELFQPIADEIALNSNSKTAYTSIYSQHSKYQYIYVSQLKKIINELQEIVEKMKKRG